MEDENRRKQVLVLFGGTGDLARKKILPALRDLYREGSSPPILAVGRQDIDVHRYIQDMGIEEYEEPFLEKLHYRSIDVTQERSKELKDTVESLSREYGCNRNYTFYLALPYFLFSDVCSLIKKSGLDSEDTKIALEKPFGDSLNTAQTIHENISGFDENQIYRVDHYLGKEQVENILTVRFANPLFEKIWDGSCIDNVQITMSEGIGVKDRTSYYEEAGAIRDVFQNHLLQLLCLTAMEKPGSLKPSEVSDRKTEVLENLEPVSEEDIVTGQYGPENTKEGQKPGYTSLEGIDKDSDTETFFALKTRIDTDKWRDTPFYIRSGKRMEERYAQINLVLEDNAEDLFKDDKTGEHDVVSIKIQPDSGIAARFHSKREGEGGYTEVEPVKMESCRPCRTEFTPDAYQHVLEEILKGDHTIFVRWDWMKESWRYTDQVLTAANNTDLSTYKPGTEGPEKSLQLLQKEDDEWVKID